MENITEILKAAGLEIPADKLEAFNTSFNANYKTVAELEKVKEKLTTKEGELIAANDKITELGKSLKEYEGSDETVKGLREKVAEYEKADADRIQAEKDRKADEELTAIIVEAIGDKKFVNDYTRASIIEDVKKGMAEQKGKGAKEVFEAITKDKEGIFENPQTVKTMPQGGSGSNGPKGADAEFLKGKYKDNPFFRG